MTDKIIEQLTSLSIHLASRREAILTAWRTATAADAAITTASSLTRAQFNDHIPNLLDAFQRKLQSRPDTNQAEAAEKDQAEQEVKHGMQRWQQGYHLGELMHEWGHLHLCLYQEIENFMESHEMDGKTLAVAQRELICLIHEGINHSAGQYAKMQQGEAAGRIQDLQEGLNRLSEIERRRGEWIHQAVHDLRGNMQSVATAADILKESDISENERLAFAHVVQEGSVLLSEMLNELMDLARLEAGVEKREISTFNAADLIREINRVSQPVAAKRNLELNGQGPENMVIDGDVGKVRRIIQNLLLNALKYTEYGTVSVSWGEEKKSWWVMVKDSGPGLLAGPGSPIAASLREATDIARESDSKADAAVEGKPSTLPAPQGGSILAGRKSQPSGEGIGLSIVKRLCELFDASIEVASSAKTGTTFRVVFPRSY